MRGFAAILVLLPLLFLSYLLLSLATKNKGAEIVDPSKLQTVPRSASLEDKQTSLEAINQDAQLPTPQPSPTKESSPDPLIESEISFLAAPSPSPSPKPVSNPNVSSGGNYTVVTYDLGSVTVVTDSANDDDCGNNCPTKPLAQYVSENGGKAGINGTYFCPPDYSWCSGKVGSYDFPIWNNRKNKWMRSDTLFWGGRGMMVFRPGSAQFFSCANCVGAPTNITGGIVNYPSLLAGGNIVLDEGAISDNLKVTKGTRSGIGFGGGKLFLVVARSANMRDLANIFKSLGATDALNLDGGGSSALYSGGYKAGPGRLLPNAVIVK